MITYADLVAAFPEAKTYDEDAVKPFIDAANIGLPDARFAGGAASAQRGRLNYVMHMLTKPMLDLKAPHILAQMGTPKPGVIKPHPWTGTEYGEALRKAIQV